MIKGNVTGLRAVQESDLNLLLGWRNNPEYRRFFREYRELSMEQQHQWFSSVVLKDDKTRMFSIVELDTGELIGACGLCYIDWINRSSDFSLYIGKDDLYIDDVYSFDAGETMINYAFGELNLHRIWAEIYSIDKKKAKLFDRLGFIHEATHKETHWTDGEWVDSLYYRLINESNR